MDITAGSAFSFRIDFVDERGSLPADAASVYYRLIDGTGADLIPSTSIAADVSNAFVTVALDATKHTISAPKQFERRTLLVDWVSEGKSHARAVRYRVVSFAPFSTSFDEVRTFFGLDSDELRDDEIDLHAAYYKVAADVVDIDTNLSSGTITEVYANNLVLAQAVLNLVPSLQLRTIQVHANGTERVERFRATPDWELIAAQAADLYDSNLAALTGDDTLGGNILAISTQSDPITGV